MEPSTLELKVPRRTLVRSTSNRRQHSLLLPLPPSRGAQRTWGRARTPPLFRHRYSSQLGLLHIASDLFSSITVHYDELQYFSLPTRLHPHFLLFEAFLVVLPPHLRAASKVFSAQENVSSKCFVRFCNIFSFLHCSFTTELVRDGTRSGRNV